jgi:ribosome-associated protein
MPISDNTPPEPLSKSQRKRDMHALQDIGKTLVGLSDKQLAKIPLSEELLELIKAARTDKGRETQRRQLQYIGKRMRDIDVEPILKALKYI